VNRARSSKLLLQRQQHGIGSMPACCRCTTACSATTVH
jgi:hypothetical protein